jgi:AraC-like DNA-binding protein
VTDRAGEREPLGSPADARPAYAERAPSALLARWVRCWWSIRGDASTPVPNRILPDGCADVIVDLAGAPRAFAVGPMRSADVVTLAGPVDMLGARFRPGAALALLDVPLDALLDRDVPLHELWGALAAELEESVAAAPPDERIACAERVLAARLARVRARRESETVARAVALLRRARGGVGVRDVASALGVGERWLERAFARHVGYGPKTLARVERLQHVVRLVQHGPVRAWTAIALDAGYADQAHLVREFRALAGVTPTEYARERRSVGFVQDEERENV